MKRTILSVIAVAILVCSVFALTACQKDPSVAEDGGYQVPKETNEDSDAATKDPYLSGTHHALVKIEGYGTIELEIYSDVAPKTAQMFCNLADEGYYDGKSICTILSNVYTTFGDTSESAKGKYLVEGEYEEAGKANNISLKKGIIAMARAEENKKSDASSFMVIMSDLSYLDGKYAAFGRVSDGIDVLEEIQELTVQIDDTEAMTAAKQALAALKQEDDKTEAQAALQQAIDEATADVASQGKIAIDANGNILNSKQCPVIKSIVMEN